MNGLPTALIPLFSLKIAEHGPASREAVIFPTALHALPRYFYFGN